MRCIIRAVGIASIAKPLLQAAMLLGCIAAIAAHNAHALQYQRVPLDPPRVIISARGPIVPGDFERFVNFLGVMPDTDRVIGLALDSQGGNVFEAEKMAGAIRRLDTSILVSDGSECSSACFLLFAAGSRRFVRPDALIGVHSVSENGKETIDAMALTTAMARDAADLGVPSAIIGKLVQTPPGRTTWLTPPELASMGVRVLERTVSDPLPRNSAPSANTPPQRVGSPIPLYPRPTDEEPKSKAHMEGAADRRAWETWFGGLSGAYKDGAEYWTGQRSTPQPGSCYGPAGQNLGDWTAGCLDAKRSLALSDIRRKSEPDYRAGWNSYQG
jgi:hypothetical protein